MIENENINTINELLQKLIDTYEIEIEHSWLYRYCKKNSIALIKKHD